MSFHFFPSLKRTNSLILSLSFHCFLKHFSQNLSRNQVRDFCRSSDLEKVKEALPLFYQMVSDLKQYDDLNLTALDVCLHQACIDGHQKLITLLLEHNANARSMIEGFSPLMTAVLSGNEDIVNILLKEGIDVNQVSQAMSNTALHLAAKLGLAGVVTSLLHWDANVNATNNNGDSPLHIATVEENPGIVSVLLEHGADINAKNDLGFSPLRNMLIKTKNENMACFMLDLGADPNEVDNDGFPLFHLSVLNEERKLASCLLKKGVNINVRDKGGFSSLDIVLKKRDTSALRILLDLGISPYEMTSQGEPLLPLLIMKNYHLLVREMLKLPLDPNVYKNQNGDTLLHLAVKSVTFLIVEMILESPVPVDLEIMNVFEMTALHVAAQYGSVDIATLLLDAGAKVDEDGHAFTPLCEACKGGHVDVVSALISFGANVNQKCWELTPLILAMHFNHKEVVARLLVAGADVTIKGPHVVYSENYPIHIATLYDKVETLRLLVKYGADVDLLNNQGDTSLTIALRENKHRTATELVKLGAMFQYENHGDLDDGDISAIQRGLQLQNAMKGTFHSFTLSHYLRSITQRG